MNRLRQTLGDSADNPRYVETIAGRGYRFIAPVHPARPDGERVSSPPRSVWKWIGACAIAPGIALSVIASLRYFQSVESPVAALTSAPLTAEQGSEVQPSLSPDGNYVAFAHNKDDSDNYDIYMKTIGSDGIVRLTSSAAHELSPAWSPDGRSLAFIRLISDQTAAVLRMTVDGGSERQLGQIVLPWFERTPSTVGPLLSWSPDGEWLATSSRKAQADPAGIVMISVVTGEMRWVTRPPATTWGDFSPSFSPDGERVSFARYLSPVVSDIHLANPARDSSEPHEAKRLTFFNRLSSSPVWTSNGNEILFSCDCSSHHRRFWRIPASKSAKATPVEGVGENCLSLSLSRRGDRLVYATQIADANIWQIELSQRRNKGAKISRVIASTRLENTPDYSPDGRQIAYQSERSGNDEIWIANRDGSSSRQLTRLSSKVSGFPRWSPDGRSLVFHARVDGPANLFIADVATGALRKLTEGTGENTAPSWSRNGEWIYFGSPRAGQRQIWRISRAGGEAIQVTKNGGAMGVESFDGGELIYSKPEERGLWVLDLRSGSERRIATALTDFSTFAVARSGVYMLCNLNEQPARWLNLVSYKTGEIIRRAEIQARVDLGLSVSPDETSVLYTQLEYRGADLSLVENFR